MSNILLLFCSPIKNKSIPCFYNQFSKAFEDSGHDVLIVNSFIPKHTNEYICSDLIKKICDFNPNLIIAFNHTINEELYKKTNCPVIAFEADTIDVFANFNLMQKYQDRLYLGLLNQNRIKIVKNQLPWLKDKNILIIKNSTTLKPESLNQDINISCIATLIGLGENNLTNNLIANIKNENYINNFKLIYDKAIEDWSKINSDDFKYLNCSYIEFFHFVSFYSRLYILDNIASLGLNVYGDFIDLRSILNLRDLFFSLKKDTVLSIAENQNLYNRSKLSVNVHFAHNIKKPEYSVYSWRVCDIMATNACIISTECPALDQDFGKWVKIPQFSNKHEAYDLSKKLLLENNLRKDIVAGSQLAIKEGNFTFYHRVKEIEEVFNLKPNEKKQELKYFYSVEFSKDATQKVLENPYLKITKKLLRLIYKLNIERIVNFPKKLIKIVKKLGL